LASPQNIPSRYFYHSQCLVSFQIWVLGKFWQPLVDVQHVLRGANNGEINPFLVFKQ